MNPAPFTNPLLRSLGPAGNPSAEASGALFSPSRSHRYSLWRVWDATAPLFAVVGLNPSTADETRNDPTVTRCINFAKREQCGGLVMLNLFALRATDPRVMKSHPEPIGSQNDDALLYYTAIAKITVAAWGVYGEHMDRERQVAKLLDGRLWCFGYTKDRHPRHPLYLPANAPLERLEWLSEAGV